MREPEKAVERIKIVMARHKLTFLEANGIDSDEFRPDVSTIEQTFFNRLNSPMYDNYPHFCYLVETYMDFDAVIRKMNDELYQRDYQKQWAVVAAYSLQDGNVISEPVQQRA
jgi:hypothetical protein